MIRIEQWILSKQKKNRFSFSKSILFVISHFYKFAVWFRHKLYDLGFYKSAEASLPVVSVGNIVCGGTGKSEFVSKLVTDLNRNDIAILSRGYRSKRVGASRVVKDIFDGDEPYMLSQRLKNSKVIVGRKREESAKLAKELNASMVLLDDGMQYLKLKKDLQVVMVRADDPFGGGFVPYGLRRELTKKLNEASFIGIHGAESCGKYELVKRSLLCYTPAKCFGTHYCLNKNKKLIGMKVGVFCGLGNPQFFMNELQKLGLEIVNKRILADHEKILSLKEFCAESIEKGAETVVCTTKDFVKLSDDEKSLVTPIEVDMKISYDTENYKDLIDTINNSLMK